jgi:hypothetical protein
MSARAFLFDIAFSLFLEGRKGDEGIIIIPGEYVVLLFVHSIFTTLLELHPFLFPLTNTGAPA